jgi:hypothetical protein
MVQEQEQQEQETQEQEYAEPHQCDGCRRWH